MNKKPLHRNVLLLAWASFFNDVASEMIVPLLPVFLLGLGAGKQVIGWIEGVADFISSMLKLFAGAWSDRLSKRKWLIISGYAMPALLRPLIGLATSWWHVFLIRSGDRFGKGIRTSARDALIADSTPADQRGYAFGFHRAMDHLGAALGPVIAFLFLLWMPGEVRFLMLLAIIPGVIVTLLVMFGLQEQPRQSSEEKTPFRFQVKELGRDFWWFMLVIAVFSLGASSDMFILVRLKELGIIDEKYLLIIWCVFHLLKSGGNLVFGKLTDVVTPKWLIILGWLLYAVIYGLFGLITSEYVAIGLFMVYAFYYAMTEPPERALVAQMVPAKIRGQAFGWYHFITGVIVLPASVLFGWLYDHYDAKVPFLVTAAIAVTATVLMCGLQTDKQVDQQNM